MGRDVKNIRQMIRVAAQGGVQVANYTDLVDLDTAAYAAALATGTAGPECSAALAAGRVITEVATAGKLVITLAWRRADK